MTSKNIRKYYAEKCEYGHSTMSERDRLYAFPSKQARDAWTDDDWEYCNALTAADARHDYGTFAMQLADVPGSRVYETYDGNSYTLRKPYF